MSDREATQQDPLDALLEEALLEEAFEADLAAAAALAGIADLRENREETLLRL